MEQKTWIADIKETEDGSGDSILTLPEELLKEKGWIEGTVLNLEVEESPTGNVLIITEVKK